MVGLRSASYQVRKTTCKINVLVFNVGAYFVFNVGEYIIR